MLLETKFREKFQQIEDYMDNSKGYLQSKKENFQLILSESNQIEEALQQKFKLTFEQSNDIAKELIETDIVEKSKTYNGYYVGDDCFVLMSFGEEEEQLDEDFVTDIELLNEVATEFNCYHKDNSLELYYDNTSRGLMISFSQTRLYLNEIAKGLDIKLDWNL